MLGDKTYTLNDFNFQLPSELIAQYPSDKREECRLFVLDRDSGRYHHRVFHEIEDFLVKGDVLVLNDARVIPARILVTKESGGVVETILVNHLFNNRWLVLCNRTKRLKINKFLTSVADPSVKFKVLRRVEDYIEVETNVELNEVVLNRIGEIPLPPYIRRDVNEYDKERYQTVYSNRVGAVASPTAGLHFTKELMKRLIAMGVIIIYITLYVSWGTFQPVRENDLTRHKMYSERFYIPEESIKEINRARSEGRRIVAVGTTSLRTLESTFDNSLNSSVSGETDIFIYPPYKIRSIDALITNFHTPNSTLLMLVSAFAGYERIMDAYKEAIDIRYRFFSYGDAMLIL
ncbi:MAG: tRNA preQ1(34) S-adenosylmethionine ribosyltransferase-isomerase QueA [Spirochaetota bacterium]|nr:tRNA preQ1(34) S-adenosylmethionine ribosyltransferase-isomerase QueA [Spirochaetota bacterium]